MKVSTKAEVIKTLQEQQIKLYSFGVRRCSLFGSFLYDQAAPESDIDLLVEFEPDQKTFTNFSNLVFFLENLFERKVEVITFDSLSPYLGPHILREAEYVPFHP